VGPKGAVVLVGGGCGSGAAGEHAGAVAGFEEPSEPAGDDVAVGAEVSKGDGLLG